MNDSNKFRVRHIIDKFWIPELLCSMDPDGTISIKRYNSMFVQSSCVVERCSGLRDCKRTEEFPKGQLIYEGDILEICNGSVNGIPWPEKNRVVQIQDALHCNIPGWGWKKDGSSNFDRTHWIKVIGNIHDNPELIP